MTLSKYLATVVVALMLAGCASPHVKPGRVETALATQVQPQNPKEAASLKTDSVRTMDFIAPAGTVISQKDPLSQNVFTFTISTNMPVQVRQQDTVDSSIGAADMSIGKLIAKLQSVKWIQGVGVVVFLFGATSLVYPPLRLLVGSVTTSLIFAASGVSLIVLPIIVVGNEIPILLGCVGVAGAYLFVHRYGKKSGEVEVLKRWVDKNQDGKVDPGEMV